MGIFLFIRVSVMATMRRSPLRRGILQVADPQDGESSFKPQRYLEAPVRQQAMKADVDTDGVEQIETHE